MKGRSTYFSVPIGGGEMKKKKKKGVLWNRCKGHKANIYWVKMSFSLIVYIIIQIHCKVSRKPCQFQELSGPKIISHRKQQIPESSCWTIGKNKNLNQNIHWFDCHGWLGLAWSLAGSVLYWEMMSVFFLCRHVFSEV